jgi:hypothetical protein
MFIAGPPSGFGCASCAMQAALAQAIFLPDAVGGGKIDNL